MPRPCFRGSAANSPRWDEFIDHAPDESVPNARPCNRGNVPGKGQK